MVRNKMIWFDRKFTFTIQPEMYAIVLERLRGTPARLEEKVKSLPSGVLKAKEGDKWSILENIGHLVVCFDLWEPRIEDFKNRAKELRPADLANAKTKQAGFNDYSVDDLLKEFRAKQANLVRQFESFGEDEVELSSHHPRLNQPMRLIDLAFFIAEHDDHHLACITDLARTFAK